MFTQAISSRTPLVTIEQGMLRVGELKLPLGCVKSCWRADESKSIEFTCVRQGESFRVKAVFPTIKKVKDAFTEIFHSSAIPFHYSARISKIQTKEDLQRDGILFQFQVQSDAVWFKKELAPLYFPADAFNVKVDEDFCVVRSKGDQEGRIVSIFRRMNARTDSNAIDRMLFENNDRRFPVECRPEEPVVYVSPKKIRTFVVGEENDVREVIWNHDERELRALSDGAKQLLGLNESNVERCAG